MADVYHGAGLLQRTAVYGVWLPKSEVRAFGDDGLPGEKP